MEFLHLPLSDPAQLSAPAQPLPPSDYPLDLEMRWRGARSDRQTVLVGSSSILLHVIGFLLAVKIPSFVQQSTPEPVVVVHRTPLYFPRELTQKAPNRNKPTKEIDLASLIASQREQHQQQASPNPSVRQFEPPHQVGVVEAKKAPQIMAEAPNLAMNQTPTDASAGAVNGLTPAPPPPNAKPSQLPALGAQVPPKITQPKTPPPPGTPSPAPTTETQSVPAAPVPSLNGQIGNARPAIELLSDPQGADFRDDLQRILTIVRANWARVRPSSLRIRGRTVVQFMINRDGSIPKVILAEPSGVNQLDLAASTSLVMSNPLPQLPPDFKGYQVKIAFIFDYNMPVQ
jgi:TonB family protein